MVDAGSARTVRLGLAAVAVLVGLLGMLLGVVAVDPPESMSLKVAALQDRSVNGGEASCGSPLSAGPVNVTDSGLMWCLTATTTRGQSASYLILLAGMFATGAALLSAVRSPGVTSKD